MEYSGQPYLAQELGFYQAHSGPIKANRVPFKHLQKQTGILLPPSLSAMGSPNNLKTFRSYKELN